MTYTPPFPTSGDDIIDSRDVIFHIADLNDQLLNSESADEIIDIEDELAPLLALAEEADTLSDWEYGAQLIRDDYFTTYAQGFAEDVGAIDEAARWPATCIDWEWAARELQMDYTPVEFDGVAYWAR